MKNIIIIGFLSIFTIIVNPIYAGPEQEPPALAKPRETSPGQNATLPPDAQFLSHLEQYGGAHLVRTYLELNEISAHQKNLKLSPRVIDKMIKAKAPPAEIQMVISEEIAHYENEAKRAAKALTPLATPPSASADSAPPPNAARLSKPVDPQIMASPKQP